MQKTVLAIWLMVSFLKVSATVFAQGQEQNLQTLSADAAAAQSRGDFASAAEFYRKATEIDPSIPELWANLGLMEHQIGKSSDAIQSFKRAIRLKPSLFVPQLFLGIEYLAAKDPTAALPYLETAGKLHPNDLQAALSLGSDYEMLGRADSAAEAYSRATEIAPGNGNAWLSLGTAYLQQVENDARVMTSTDRNSAYVMLRAAETLTDEGSQNTAVTWYKKAIASAPIPPCAHAEFGITLLRLKRVADAEAQFQWEQRTASPCGLARLGSAIAVAANGHPDSAVAKLSSIAATDPAFVQSSLPLFRGVLSANEVNSLVNVARGRKATGEPNLDIASLIETAFASGGVPPATAVSKDETLETHQAAKTGNSAQLYATGQYTRCDHSLKPAIARLPFAQQRLLASCSFYTSDFSTSSRAAAHLKANATTRVEGLYWESKADEKLAVAALARAGEIEPDSPRMHVLLGDIFRQKRRWSDAETEYRRAIALDPNIHYARLSLAIVLFTELKSEEALRIDKALLEEAPDNPEGNLLAASILVQEHDFEKAEPFLSKCQNLKVDLIPRYHILLGQVYAATNRIPAAIAEYEQGLATDQDGSLHYRLARLYQKVGDKANAEKDIRMSQEIRARWDEQAHIALGQESAQASGP